MRDLIWAMVIATIVLFFILMGPIIVTVITVLFSYAILVLAVWLVLQLLHDGPHDPDDPGP